MEKYPIVLTLFEEDRKAPKFINETIDGVDKKGENESVK